MIRRAILDSEKFNSLKVFAQNFFMRLLLVADDYGLCDARPVMLRCALYPLALEKVSESDVSSGLTACEEAGLVRLYSVEGKAYLQICNYGQRQRTAAKYPLPPWQGKNGGKLQQVAASCSRLQQVTADCGKLQQNAAQTQTQTQTETQTEAQPQPCAHAQVQARGPGEPAAAAAGSGFDKWKEAMCRAFPTLRGVAKLSETAEEAAREAYERMPVAAEKAELLAAFLDDRLPMDRYHNKFYRPVSQIKFFDNLEDVVRHAELWQRETGWGKGKPKPKQEKRAESDERPATEEEKQAFFADMRASLSGLAAQADFKNLSRQRKPMTPAEEAEAAAEREAILRRVKGGDV